MAKTKMPRPPFRQLAIAMGIFILFLLGVGLATGIVLAVVTFLPIEWLFGIGVIGVVLYALFWGCYYCCYSYFGWEPDSWTHFEN